MANRKMYGNVINRFCEGRTVPEIKEGMGITMYHWSDRTCYYVDKVNSQKDILVKEYYVCADHSKSLGMGHQEWMYFKHKADMNRYLNENKVDTKFHYDEDAEDNPAENWVYRYNNWYRKYTYNKETLSQPSTIPGKTVGEVIWIEDKEMKQLETKGEFSRYYKLDNKVSFGVANYYYDWEF